MLSMQITVIHKRDRDWSVKLTTESNSTLSMSIVSTVTLRLEDNRSLLHPQNDPAIFQPQYLPHTIWETAFAHPPGQHFVLWESALWIGVWTRSRFLYEELEGCPVSCCISPIH